MDLIPYMEQFAMLPEPGGVVLCAVSGGRDSMCLLHYLYSISAARGFTVAAAHLNHLMRGADAGRDERFVRDFCASHGIPFYTEAVPVYEMAEAWNLSVEETGRRARYDFLERTADANGASRIATAHHMGDQAETVILNLLRGTGTEGLGGIPPVRGRYIRPLLNTTRQEIEAYLDAHGIGHVEDSTNTDLHYARNRLRLDIWERLESINPAARENIARTAGIVRRESDYLNALAAEYLPKEGTAVDCDVLLSAPEVLQRRMVRLLLDRLPAGKKDVGAVHIEGILTLAASGGTLNLPAGMTATCRDGRLMLSVSKPATEEITLTAGENRWGDYTIILSETSGDFALRPGTFTVRTWQSRDRLTLPGSRGSRSLKRLFTDAGIPVEERNHIPVLCVDGCAAAVPGIGIHTEFLPEDSGKEIYFTMIKNQ